MCECSVVVLTYNCELSKILLTLESAVRQQKINFEIIVADDCSEVFDEDAVKAYFEQKNVRYQILRRSRNVGTVRNVYHALLQCKGRYVKLLGAGDLLYASDTLYQMCACMRKSRSTVGFGLMKEFYRKEGSFYKQVRISPNNIAAFINADDREIYRMLVKYEQWLSGASLIYDTQNILPFIKEMTGKVRYCEDMVTALVVIRREKICYTNCYSVWYEADSGISNNRERKYGKRILEDQAAFYKIVQGKDRGLWRRLGKRVIHSVSDRRLRALLKLFFQPGIVLLVLKTEHQKKKGMYELNQEGFLDCVDYEKDLAAVK